MGPSRIVGVGVGVARSRFDDGVEIGVGDGERGGCVGLSAGVIEVPNFILVCSERFDEIDCLVSRRLRASWLKVDSIGSILIFVISEIFEVDRL